MNYEKAIEIIGKKKFADDTLTREEKQAILAIWDEADRLRGNIN